MTLLEWSHSHSTTCTYLHTLWHMRARLRSSTAVTSAYAAIEGATMRKRLVNLPIGSMAWQHDRVADDRMRGIDEAVNSLFQLPRGPTGFRHILRLWRTHQQRAEMLSWSLRPPEAIAAQIEDVDLVIQVIDAQRCSLSLEWLGTARRGVDTDLGSGPPENLLSQLRDLMLSGGPFGGPRLDTQSGQPHRYWWVDSQLPDRARVRYFGDGYAFRHRPLRDERYLAVVAPTGSFITCGGGKIDDVATLSEEVVEKLDPFAAELGDSSFHVRLLGDPVRLRYAAVPGLLGYRLVDHDAGPLELFLCLLGKDDLALVCLQKGSPRMLARGTSHQIVGTEVLPRASESRDPPAAPATLAPGTVAAAIRGLSSLTPATSEHLAGLAAAAHGRTGMRSVRLLLWQVASAHELGLRINLSGQILHLFSLLAATTGIELDALPHDRARRPALKWLSERSPFFYPLGMNRDRWAIRSDWLGAPPLGCFEIMKGLSSVSR